MNKNEILNTILSIPGATMGRQNKTNFVVIPTEEGFVKVKGPNPEAQARRDELDAKLGALPSFADYTATDIYNALAGQIADNVTVMAVGSSAMRLVDQGVLTVTMDEKKKKHYTKA